MTFALLHWRAIGALVLVAVLGLYIETLRVERDHAYAQEDRAKADLALFKGEVKTLGDQAKIKAAADEAANKKRKEEADAENSSALATLADTIKRLRDDPRRGVLPPAAPGALRPDLACYDRAELGGAYGILVSRLRGGADEGSKATVDLNTAKRWALKLATEIKPKDEL